MNLRYYKSYAKVNIGLQILDKRSDGYHNINTLFQEIDLYDTIKIKKIEQGCNFVSNVDWLKNNDSNLCVTAWKELSKHFDIGGVSISLEKKIPIKSGLGGGSSNAATILKGICEIYSLDLTRCDLSSIAIRLGADVPFFLTGGLQSASGIGENLSAHNGCIEGSYLLVIPDQQIETKWAYSKCKKILQTNKEALKFEDILKEKITSFKLFENDFESIVIPAYPQIAEIKDKLLSSGPKYVSLSGSGSTVFGIYDDEVQAKSAESLFPEYTTFIANPIRNMHI